MFLGSVYLIHRYANSHCFELIQIRSILTIKKSSTEKVELISASNEAPK
jgi:hypothetical protein